MKFIILVVLVLLAFTCAQKTTVVPSDKFPVFAPAGSGINVLPLSVETDEDVALTVDHVFSHDEKTLTEDSGVETEEEQNTLVLEDANTEEKTQEAAAEEKETHTEEILEDTEALSILNAQPLDKKTLEEEKMVQEAEKTQANTLAIPDVNTCLDFCKKTGSDDNFCKAHCSK